MIQVRKMYLEKLSDFCLDIAKGMVLAGLALPTITQETGRLYSIQSIIMSGIFLLLAYRCLWEIKRI